LCGCVDDVFFFFDIEWQAIGNIYEILNVFKAVTRMVDVRELFHRERARFDTSLEFAISVSKFAASRKANIPNVMASYVFTRMCVGADSLRYLLVRDIGRSKDLTLDHCSISVLARNIGEATLMFHYLLEDGVSDEEWALRGKVLDLHDV